MAECLRRIRINMGKPIGFQRNKKQQKVNQICRSQERNWVQIIESENSKVVRKEGAELV